MTQRTHSDACTSLVKEFEGCELKAYKDQVGVWTNGYGNTHGVTAATKPITQAQADADLDHNLGACDDDVNRICNGLNITQHQHDALVSFVFNLGGQSLAGSTLMTYLRSGNVQAAANEFGRWNKAGGVPNKGLTRRRAAERELFLRP
jgi:lysozyme